MAFRVIEFVPTRLFVFSGGEGEEGALGVNFLGGGGVLICCLI